LNHLSEASVVAALTVPASARARYYAPGTPKMTRSRPSQVLDADGLALLDTERLGWSAESLAEAA